MILQIFLAGLGTAAFAVLFGVPRKHLIYCGITGSAGWMAYLLLLQTELSTVVATFGATIVICALARWFSVRRRTPTTVFLLCGIFTLVPGAGIYYTAYHLFMDNGAAAADEGAKTIRAAVAIALGIAATYSIPSKVFGWTNKPAIWDSGVKKAEQAPGDSEDIAKP